MNKKCLVCKKSTVEFSSVEHIIPESMGNKTETIAKGIICDACNNKFSEIEKKFIELPVISQLISRLRVISKKGKIKKTNIIFNGMPSSAKIKDRTITIDVPFNLVNNAIYNCNIVLPNVDISTLNNSYIVSKFLSKLALELYIKICIQEFGIQKLLERSCFPCVIEMLRLYLLGGFENFLIPYTVVKLGEIIPFQNCAERSINLSMRVVDTHFYYTFYYGGIQFEWNTRDILKYIIKYSKKSKLKFVIHYQDGKDIEFKDFFKI